MIVYGRRRRARFVAAVVLCLVFMATPLAAHSLPVKSQGVKVVPTVVCTCSSQPVSTPSGARTFQPGIPSGSGLYDEQVGVTFTQSFRSIEYNVTAVEQTDPGLGDGPAYLLNGLSSTGYWYQVGFSWNWTPGQTPGTGFDMNFEVFNTAGNSVFPSGGAGGIQAFSGPVNDGDVILLDLYFSNATQSVVMVAMDTDTGASASESYSNQGATYFMGLPSSVASTNGFFTGLMTEWYHGSPYYADEAEVIYSNPHIALSSGWMWIDEFDANTLQGIFAANTSSPVSFSDPTQLQKFSFNGTTEYADAYEFVTGALTNSTQHASPTMPLTLSFSVLGGRSGYSAPELTYLLNGSSVTTPLTASPMLYNVDAGSNWSVSPTLGGSTSVQRWGTGQSTSGVANSPETVEFVYYGQSYVTFGFSVLGGGAGASLPSVTYVSFGSSATTPAGTGVWADSGSKYSYSNPLPGSTTTERWYAVSGGSIGASQQVAALYYRQYLVTFDISFRNTEIFPGLSLESTSAGQRYSATLVSGANREWLDAGSAYSVPQSSSLESGQRMATNASSTGQASANLTVALVYEHQFYIGINQSVPAGGTTSPQSGWYDSGTTLQLEAVPGAGWQSEGWLGTGSDSVTGPTSSLQLIVGPGAPANETAVFYPGITIEANGPVSVSYTDGSKSGTVSGGSSTMVYLPSSSTLSLTASSAELLTTFGGWDGANKSSGVTTSVLVVGPAMVISNSSYDYAGIGALIAVIVLIVAVTIALLKRTGSPSMDAGAEDGP